MILDTTTKSLEVVLGGAITTNQLDWSASYVDIDQTTFGITSASESDGVTNNGTAVTMVAAPSSGNSRQIKELSIYNRDTVAATVTIQINDNGTLRLKVVVTLDPGDTLAYA